MKSTDSVLVPLLIIVAIQAALFLFLVWGILKWAKEYFKKKTVQEKMLLDELKVLKDIAREDDLIRIYEKSKWYNRNSYYDVLSEIISRLVKLKAFPKDVMDWLDSVDGYSQENLFSIMEEFIAMRSGTLKDDVAVSAYLDGFISATEALDLTDKTRYPKTVKALLDDPEDYSKIRSILEKEAKEYRIQ